MASNYLAIIAGIKALLETVTGIGVVNDYSRLTVNWADYIARFKADDGRINGVEITRSAVPEHLRGVFFRHHVFVLRFFMGLQDAQATDKIFQVLLDEACAAFRTAADGASWEYAGGDNPDDAPAQVQLIDERMFGNVLCHYAEIRLTVTERII